MKKPTVAIVGGSGYIGSALSASISKVFDVRVVDRNPPRIGRSGVSFEQCNIVDYNDVTHALKGADLVIHTAIIQIPQILDQKKLAYEVNFLGTQNVCRAVDESPSAKGMILSGTWHVFGEKDLDGTIDETFGFRPDKVEERARLYALSKITQEVLMRYYDEMSKKIYGVIRMGTVLGEGMPEKTAANIFISKGLKGEPLTPFKHSMHRPMLYIDIQDICRAFEIYARKIAEGSVPKEENGLSHIVNLCWSKPISILDLAHMVRDTIVKLTANKIRPAIDIVDEHKPVLYKESDKEKLRVDTSKIQRFLGMSKLTDPRETIERLVKDRLTN